MGEKGIMNCAVCGASKASEFLVVNKFTLVKCEYCGLIYSENFISDDISYYDDFYFAERNRYISRWDEFCSIFDSLLDKIVLFKREGNLLDVGAGVGTLMYVAAKRGFKVKGVEVSDWAATFCRETKGLDVVTGKLENLRLGMESFDVVVINHVLEHVDNPRLMLSEIRRILKRDGIIVVGVPNIGSLMARIKSSKWVSLRPEEHIWQFTPATLKRLIKQEGFDIVHFEAKENHPVGGWGPKDLVKRIINFVSVVTDRSEAMLVFGCKSSEKKYE